MMDEITKYDNKESDPFYKTKFFENNLTETPTHYMFQVEIPEHEKENIDVRVQDKMITLSGLRQHKESFEAEGQRFRSNSNESFYQEIPLENTVKTKDIKTWYEDGIFKVIAPKV